MKQTRRFSVPGVISPDRVTSALNTAMQRSNVNLLNQAPSALQAPSMLQQAPSSATLLANALNAASANTAANAAAAAAAAALVSPPAPTGLVNAALFKKGSGDVSVVLGNAVLSLPAGRLATKQTAQLALTHLYNTYRQSMLIDEIRFFVIPSTLLSSNGVGLQNGVAGIMASNIGVRLQCGAIQITREFVRLDSLATSWQDLLAFGADGLVQDATTTGSPNTTSFRRWLPPCPILVRPGEVVDCNLQTFDSNLAATGSSNPVKFVDVHVTYIGRLVDTPDPEYIDYPYVADYAFTSAVAYAEPDWRQFLNPYDAPMKVQRFIANTYNVESSLAGIGPPGGDLPDNSLILQLTDSFGYPIVPFYTDIFQVIDPNRRAWTFNRELGPREHFDFTLRGNTTYLALLAMVCTHTERLQ